MLALVSRILLVIKSPPYGGERAAEGFRMATAMIAMDMLPKILFIDDGVYCLIRNQAPEAAGLTSFRERLKTLSDLIGLYAASDSIVQRKLMQSDMDENFHVKSLSLDETTRLISQNETIITF